MTVIMNPFVQSLVFFHFTFAPLQMRLFAAHFLLNSFLGNLSYLELAETTCELIGVFVIFGLNTSLHCV